MRTVYVAANLIDNVEESIVATVNNAGFYSLKLAEEYAEVHGLKLFELTIKER